MKLTDIKTIDDKFRIRLVKRFMDMTGIKAGEEVVIEYDTETGNITIKKVEIRRSRMKVKDLEKLSCLDCPIRREGYCKQPDDPVCAELDEDTDIEEWLENADKRQREYLRRKLEKEQKEREIRAEKERKRKLRKTREQYCAKELKELNEAKKLLRGLEKGKKDAEFTIKCDDVFTDCFGIPLRQAHCKEVINKTNEAIEVVKNKIPDLEKRYKAKLKEFKEKYHE